MLSVCSIASADRPQELQAEAAQLLENQSDAQQVLRNIEVRLVEISGALKEYALQAAQEEVPEVPEEVE